MQARRWFEQVHRTVVRPHGLGLAALLFFAGWASLAVGQAIDPLRDAPHGDPDLPSFGWAEVGDDEPAIPALEPETALEPEAESIGPGRVERLRPRRLDLEAGPPPRAIDRGRPRSIDHPLTGPPPRGSDFGSEFAPISAHLPPIGPHAYSPGPPLVPEYHAEEIEQLYERVLELEPSGETRDLIERVREVTLETELGVDVTDEEWIEVDVDDRTLIWGGRIHLDSVNWADDRDFGGQQNYVEFRRLRLFAAGVGYGVYDYQLDLEFAPEVELEATVVNNEVDLGGFGVELKDAYVGIRELPWLGYVRLGHFRTPFSLSVLTSSNDIVFLERDLPHRLTPGRELGIAAYNYAPTQNFTWAYGVFFDEIPEAEHVIEDDNQGTRLIGRATWTPLYDELSPGRYFLHTGVSYAYTRPRRQDDPLFPAQVLRPVRFDARPEIHRGDELIDTGVINAQQYQTIGTELALVRGPFSIQSEAVLTSIDRMAGDTTELYGAYVQASWFLTGEQRRYDRTVGVFEGIIPYENFWIVPTHAGSRAGWGAWELAARWSFLEFPDFADQRLDDLTVGLNWYWNRRTRLMFNWIHPFAHNSPESLFADAEGDIFAMRMQVAF